MDSMTTSVEYSQNGLVDLEFAKERDAAGTWSVNPLYRLAVDSQSGEGGGGLTEVYYLLFSNNTNIFGNLVRRIQPGAQVEIESVGALGVGKKSKVEKAGPRHSKKYQKRRRNW